MNSGFLYILSNPAMPDLVKVGKTTRDPSNRVKELSAATGVPTPFLLVYYQPVQDCDSAEKWAHAELERRGFRPNSDREFFMAPVHEAVEILNAARSIVGIAEAEVLTAPHDDSLADNEGGLADELFELGMSYLYGTDSVLANARKALKLFEQASALGHAEAAFAAGSIYRWGRDPILQDLEKSLEFYKKAVAGGNWTSLACIANIFEAAGQTMAAEKYWILFFDEASKANTSADADKQNEIAGIVGLYGYWYCNSASDGSINAVVSHQRLAEFEDALARFLNQRLASEVNLELKTGYEKSLKFLRRQIASADGFLNGANERRV